jgi:ornithine decarboxylase
VQELVDDDNDVTCQLGAYRACLRTAFNGFDRARLVEVRDGAIAMMRGVRAPARLAA